MYSLPLLIPRINYQQVVKNVLRAVSGAGFIDYAELFKHHGGPLAKSYEGGDAGGGIDATPNHHESTSSFSMSSSSGKSECPPSDDDDDIPIHMEICSGIIPIHHIYTHISIAHILTPYFSYSPLSCPHFYLLTCSLTSTNGQLMLSVGSGDWIVAHATNDLSAENLSRHKSSSQQSASDHGNHPHSSMPPKKQKIRWLALELRCDRISHTLSKSIASYWEHCSQLSHAVIQPHLCCFLTSITPITPTIPITPTTPITPTPDDQRECPPNLCPNVYPSSTP